MKLSTILVSVIVVQTKNKNENALAASEETLCNQNTFANNECSNLKEHQEAFNEEQCLSKKEIQDTIKETLEQNCKCINDIQRIKEVFESNNKCGDEIQRLKNLLKEKTDKIKELEETIEQNSKKSTVTIIKLEIQIEENFTNQMAIKITEDLEKSYKTRIDNYQDQIILEQEKLQNENISIREQTEVIKNIQALINHQKNVGEHAKKEVQNFTSKINEFNENVKEKVQKITKQLKEFTSKVHDDQEKCQWVKGQFDRQLQEIEDITQRIGKSQESARDVVERVNNYDKKVEREKITKEFEEMVKSVLNGGEDGTKQQWERKIDFANKKIMLKSKIDTHSGGALIDKGSLGYLSQKFITQMKITFSRLATFGIAIQDFNMTDFGYEQVDIDESLGFYGVSLNSNEDTNFPKFQTNLQGEFKSGETYLFTLNPITSTFSIEGGRLSQKVTRKIKTGIYFPVVFYPWKDAEITIEFIQQFE